MRSLSFSFHALRFPNCVPWLLGEQWRPARGALNLKKKPPPYTLYRIVTLIRSHGLLSNKAKGKSRKKIGNHWQGGREPRHIPAHIYLSLKDLQFYSRHVSWRTEGCLGWGQKYPMHSGIRELQQFCSLESCLLSVAAQRLRNYRT